MKLEEAKKYIRMMIRQQKIPDSAKALGYVYATEAIETVLQALDNSISKDKVKEKIEELEILVKEFEETDNTGRFRKTNSIDYYKLEAYKELLKEKEDEMPNSI